MAYPVSLSTVTVTGQVVSAGPVAAVVAFDVPWMYGPDGAIVRAHRVQVQADSEGEFTVALPATDDPDWTPTGFTLDTSIYADGLVTRGTLALPADSVTVELAAAFNPNQTAEPGVTYALSTHTHPGGGEGGPIAISDVTGLTAALSGKAPTVHTHVQGDVTGLSASLAALTPLTTFDGLEGRVEVLEAAPGGGGSPAVVRRGKVTSGNLTLAGSGPWVAVAGGPQLALPAAVGDYVEFALTSMLGNFTVNFLDLAVVVGGALVRFLSTDTATPASEGAPPFYSDQTFDRYGPIFEFEVEAGDLSGGNVTVVFATSGSGGGTIYASADYPLRWRAINHGPCDVA